MFSDTLCQLPWDAKWFDEIDSTSAEARRLADSGDYGPVWIGSLTQTGGVGRLGRKWISEPGNLYTTALLPADLNPEKVGFLALTVGLAVRDTVVDLSQGRIVPGLKWPNDVRVNGAKLSGVLIETGLSTDRNRRWVSIGIGLNLAHAPDVEGYKTTALNALIPDLTCTPQHALTILDMCLRRRLEDLTSGKHSKIRHNWLEATDQNGALCRVTLGSSIIEGRFEGLDQDGQLLLRDHGHNLQTITAGDVEMIKERN